jgi:integrase
MKQRFRLYRRSSSGRFYVHDSLTGKQESLNTGDREEAARLLHARNEAERQPAINLQIARAYLAATDADISTRTWQVVMDEVIKVKRGGGQVRWKVAIKDPAFDVFRNLPLLQTRPEHFLRALEQGTVATNVYLRRLHSFALSLTWLPWPILTRQQWPPIRHQPKRSITWEEHRIIVEQEPEPEYRAFYEMAWHLGAAQGDLAVLRAEDIDWEFHVISFPRRKTGSLTVQRFGEEAAEVLKNLPKAGPLFPKCAESNAGKRAARFNYRCRVAGIQGVTLHSYRYAWAERAKTAGYPERFAQEALGHRSKAVHQAYAKKARVELPSLEEYEKLRAARVIAMPCPVGNDAGQVAAQ